ncbi:MAG TPA: DUF1259 domain-containing protein [Steroidobacteraceae bacterium]|nr:DUF1259 domain-containing protein [Steroidobacteraceae bacterium]
MKRLAALAACLLLVLTLGSVPAHAARMGDWSKVDRVLGRQGKDLPGGVHKVGFPRSDLKVTLDGTPIRAPLAFGSWVALMPDHGGAMLMGDVVLTETEIGPVMKRLVAGGMEITAIHNHLLRTSIPIIYMHVAGQGDPVRLAETVHAALALAGTPLTQSPATSSSSAASPLNLKSLERILRAKGAESGGVDQFSVPRADSIRDHGTMVPPAMGTAIGINFEAAGDGRAAATGDFVLISSEVQPVLRDLLAHGIEITALHTHMIGDSPKL